MLPARQLMRVAPGQRAEPHSLEERRRALSRPRLTPQAVGRIVQSREALKERITLACAIAQCLRACERFDHFLRG